MTEMTTDGTETEIRRERGIVTVIGRKTEAETSATTDENRTRMTAKTLVAPTSTDAFHRLELKLQSLHLRRPRPQMALVTQNLTKSISIRTMKKARRRRKPWMLLTLRRKR